MSLDYKLLTSWVSQVINSLDNKNYFSCICKLFLLLPFVLSWAPLLYEVEPHNSEIINVYIRVMHKMDVKSQEIKLFAGAS